MDTRKEDADVKTAPAPEAPARPAPGAVPSAEPLHGPVDAAEDSLDGLQTAFGALSVEEVVSQPVKRKRESEKDAGDEADEGEEQGQDLTNDPTFEGAPSASGLTSQNVPVCFTFCPCNCSLLFAHSTGPFFHYIIFLLFCLGIGYISLCIFHRNGLH